MTWTLKLKPKPTFSRYPIITPYRIERSSLCINCGICITACIYDCHKRSEEDPRILADPKENCCRNCFACIMQCPRNALEMRTNEQYAGLGDQTYTPDRIRIILEQAEQGKIPVSGTGYRGPFSGKHYDNIWTDMSEIVRPTRDGIHGREHISTSVTMGRMMRDLCGMEYDHLGNLKSLIPLNREIPIPVIFGEMPFFPGDTALSSLALAASKLSTYLSIPAENVSNALKEYYSHLLIRIKPQDTAAFREILEWATIVELEPGSDPKEHIARVRDLNPNALTVINVPASKKADTKIVELAQRGAETIHLAADIHGTGQDGVDLLDVLHNSHLLLVEEGLRDQVTLIASGGLAAAEHVPKTIILGADIVKVDVPLLIAMDTIRWTQGENNTQHPVPNEIEELDPRWGASRVINLMLAWRDQLLEILGAMGLRDVRRLRGETGRAIFADKACTEFTERLQSSMEMNLPPNTDHGKPNADFFKKDTRLVPDRFAVKPGQWRVQIDRALCTDCGLCAISCRYGVHKKTPGKLSLDEPLHNKCIGPACENNDWCCVRICPWKALEIVRDPVEEVLGDFRWTPRLLIETWKAAKTGKKSDLAPEDLIGSSGGGFDTMQLSSKQDRPLPLGNPVNLTIPLNRRPVGPRISLALPVYGGGMSYGSVSLPVMKGRAMAAAQLGTMTCTGEGGYPDELLPFAAHIITQVATGLFGVREETIMRAPMIEFKYAQGAKPGLGGHLLGEKNTPEVARMREAVPGTNLFSPFPFHSVYSVEDHKKHVDWIRSIHPDVLVSVKVSTPADVDMVAVGSYYAGANVIHIDGAYGGTGAAPDIAKKNIAQPIELATAQTHEFLVKEGIRDDVVLIASGGIRTAEDILKTIALGADGVVVGTAELVAIDCVRCGNCERDRGCPNGIATTDPELAPQLNPEWVCDRIVNLYKSWASYFEWRLRNLGLDDIAKLRGRWDLLS